MSEVPAVMDGVWCVVPVYNNGGTVRSVVEGCLAVISRVLVVDDGSTDVDVAQALSGLPVALLTHPVNRGKGEAIMTASRYLAGRGAHYMVTIDADGQHEPGDIARFLPHLREDGSVMVIGCRDFSSPNVPGSSKFGRKFANFWLKVESGAGVDDCQSGFRAYPISALNRLGCRGRRFDFEAEVLARMSWAGIELKCIEVGAYYPPRGERISHFRFFVDNVRISHMHTQLVLRRLLPVPHQRFIPDEKTDFKLLLHPVRLVKLLLREHATPWGLAASAGVGALLATLPFFFTHSLVIFYVATRLNLNRLVALNIQHLCAPPFVPALCIEVGYYMRNGKWFTDFSFDTIGRHAPDRILDWVLGSLIVAPFVALILGLVTYAIARMAGNRRAG